MKEQEKVFESGNELAALAAKQINYHVMGYYPITPSTQIAETLDQMKAQGLHDIVMIPAEGEHSAAGICYGASAAGGRVLNATSANGLLYALEQLPVQSGTRFPMVMNVACRTVSGPLSIKGDHSDIMYALNTGWIILFANTPQMVYDMNLCAVKIGEQVNLPVIIGFDGFFTSHQKRKCSVFKKDEDVQTFVGKAKREYDLLDVEHPITIGSYMNEPDLLNNKYQLHMAMEEARTAIDTVFAKYEQISGRKIRQVEGYKTEDAEILLFLLGSSYHTAKVAVDELREEGILAGVFTTNSVRPFPKEALYACCKNAKVILAGDRQDSYGAGGGNLSIELKAMLQENNYPGKVLTRIYGLGGRDFYVEDAKALLRECLKENAPAFHYYGIAKGNGKPIAMGVKKEALTDCKNKLAPGHGACPGCGIPVNVNLLLRTIQGNVVVLFQTGCGMVVTTPYPKTAFKVPYIHNLFQNGAATITGVLETFKERQRRGEYPEGEITFVMVSGDGGMDIGLGSAIGAALRNNHFILLEYDNGGYMNTGYQLSYSTPMGARSATSHVGKNQIGKDFFHKDSPMIMAAANIPYVATVAESNPVDFKAKALKAQEYANKEGMAYIKALSACPLNWGDEPAKERQVIAAGVDSCYFPLYEIENGITKITYNPEKAGKKIPVIDFLKEMGRTKHLEKAQYEQVVKEIQKEVDRRWERLKARDASGLL